MSETPEKPTQRPTIGRVVSNKMNNISQATTSSGG